MILAERLKRMPDEIWGMPVDQALRAIHYFTFLREYEETAMEMNKPKQ